MPTYEFVHDESGDPAEVTFESMEGPDGPPSIGELIPGTKLRRVVSMPTKPTVREIRFVGHSQPDWAEGAPNYTSTGTPCFENRRQVEKYVAHQNELTMSGKSQQGGEFIEYDAAPTYEDREAKKRGWSKRSTLRNSQRGMS